MDILSILAQAVVPAVGAAVTLIAAEQAPTDKIPLTEANKKAGMTLLGAVIVLLGTVQAAQEGRIATINPEEVLTATGVAYGAALGLVAMIRGWLNK